MNIPLVMTIIGPDRTGLVELLANTVAEQGGNWLESSLSHLGGHFAGLLRIEVPEENKAALLLDFKALQSQNLTIVVHSSESKAPSPEHSQAMLEMVSHDRPGIVQQISRIFARHGVNVEELNTECVSAPMSGEALFKAQAKLHIPDTCNLDDLRSDLERIAHELMADFTFNPAC
jgi:glycine cleavage system regulatory protein